MSGITKPSSNEPDKLYAKVAELISTARQQIRSAVNLAMVAMCWQIGQLIVEDE